MGEGGAPEKSGGIGGMGQVEDVFGDWPLSEETLGTNPGNLGAPAGFTEKADAFSAQPASKIDSVINLRPQDFPDLCQVFLITRLKPLKTSSTCPIPPIPPLLSG